MSQLQFNILFNTLLTHWNQYNKQVFTVIVFTLLIISLIDPSTTVFANGATSTAGATGG